MRKNDHTETPHADEIITPEELELHFPPLRKNEGFEYSGKCSYCNVEINFSDTTEIKIKVDIKEETRKFSLYHKGCYERYFRRTID